MRQKMEANQNVDLLSDTKEPMELENETPDIPVKEIKRETGFEETDIKKDTGSTDCKHSNTQDYLEVGKTTISEPTKPETATSSKDIKAEIIEVDQELEPPEDESEEHLIEMKQEDEDDELGVEEDPDSPEIKYSNSQDYLDIGDTVISGPSGAPASISTESESATQRIKYICGICNRMLTSKKYLKRHFMRIHSEWETCDLQFKLIDIKEHSTTTGTKPFKCKFCDYRCTVNSGLKRHMRTHTGEKPYKCGACDYRCTENSYLKNHMRIHTGEKPFKCEACDYRCALEGNLKKHLRMHTGEKPYKCEACEYRCRNHSNLKTHMKKTHAGVKLYKSEACDLFTETQKLRSLLTTPPKRHLWGVGNK